MSHVCINRFSGTAADDKLFYEEFVPEGISFGVEIDASRLTADEVAFLLAVLEMGAAPPDASLPVRRERCRRVGARPVGARHGSDVRRGARRRPDRVCVLHHGRRTAGGEPGRGAAAASVHRLDRGLPRPVPRQRRIAPKVRKVNDGRTNFTALKGAQPADDAASPCPGSCFAAFRVIPRSTAATRGAPAALARRGSHGRPERGPGYGPIERIFGHTARSARLTIEEFTEVGQCAALKQDFVAIDRFTGGAGEGAKFDATYAECPRFKTRIVLDMEGLRGYGLH